MPDYLRVVPALAAIALSVAMASAHAQTTPPPGTAPAEAKPAEPAPPPAIFSIWGFDLTGHFDIGYTHLTGSGKFVSGVNDRVFDFKHNEVFFHALDLQFAKLPGSYFFPDQTQSRMPHRRRHSPHLPIASFSDGHA